MATFDARLDKGFVASIGAAEFAGCAHLTVCRSGPNTVHALFEDWGTPTGQAVNWLADDIQKLALQFSRTLFTSDILLRVEWVRDDACRKFHRDTVNARLICTYCGPGTEYGVGDSCCAPVEIDKVPTGSPILLKGKLWPNQPQTKLLHRSPPIEGTGQTRLVVVMNEASRDKPELAKH